MIHRRTFLISGGAVAAAALLPCCDLVAEPVAFSLVESLDPSTHEDADTVANCVHALALLGAPCQRAANQLWSLRDTNSGYWGWGLHDSLEPWDAFADGSDNPVGTIYGYSTARAGLAFAAAGELARAHAAADCLAGLLWDGADVEYSDQAADAGYSVWNIDGIALWLFAVLDVYPALRATLTARLEATQGVDVSAWNWEYSAGSGTRNDLHHLAFIVMGLEAVGSAAATTTLAQLSRWHAGSGKTKQREFDGAPVTSGRDPGWHLVLATTSDAAWAPDVADDIEASITDGRTSYARDDGIHGDRDQAHAAYGLAVYAAAS